MAEDRKATGSDWGKRVEARELEAVEGVESEGAEVTEVVVIGKSGGAEDEEEVVIEGARARLP